MRTALTVALLLALLGVVALCPALACFAPASAHPCCPHHKAPAALQTCPSLVLETGRTVPFVFAAVPAAVSAPLLPPAAPAGAPAPALADSRDVLLLLGTLRI